MRWIRPAFLFMAMVGGISLCAQTATPPPPQSARQALLEMLFGKGENDFKKHLPEDARQILVRKGETPETSTILRVSTFGQMFSQGKKVETFETGPIFLSAVMSETEKVECTVERDSLSGEADEIQISIHYYKDGQAQPLPVVPDLTFTLKQEKEIWRLTEITAAAHIPLTDPDYLKGLRKQQDEEVESQVRNRIVMLGSAESGYAGKHPDAGYSCSLSTLFSHDPSQNPTENGVLDHGQGNDEWYGYRFTLSSCDGTPPSKYRITAVPTDSDAGLKTFCSDESGSIKFVAGRKTSSCFSRGKPVSDDDRGSD